MPYKIPFFRSIVDNFPGKIHLYTSYGFVHPKIKRSINISNSKNLKMHYLPAINYRSICYNFGLIPNLLKSNFDVLMTGDYLFPSAIASKYVSEIKKKPTILYTVATKFIFYLPIVKKSIINYTKYIVPSSITKHNLQRLGISPDKIIQIFNPVNINLFKTIEFDTNSYLIKEKYSINKEDKVLTFVGRLVKGKGLNLLLHSFNKVLQSNENTVLLIVGDGSESNTLRTIASNLKIEDRVSFIGWVEHNTIQKIHSITDLFIFPSIPTKTNIEQFPNALLEAMSSGLPSISFDIEGGLKDIIIDGYNGIKIKKINVQSLADKILELLENDSLRIKIGKNAASWIRKNCSPETVGKQYVEAILSLDL